MIVLSPGDDAWDKDAEVTGIPASWDHPHSPIADKLAMVVSAAPAPSLDVTPWPTMPSAAVLFDQCDQDQPITPSSKWSANHDVGYHMCEPAASDQQVSITLAWDNKLDGEAEDLLQDALTTPPLSAAYQGVSRNAKGQQAKKKASKKASPPSAKKTKQQKSEVQQTCSVT